MTSRSLLTPLLLACFFCLNGCSEKIETPKQPAQAKKRINAPRAMGFRGAEVSVSARVLDCFETPEDAFVEYVKAVDSQNYRRASQLLSQESRNAIAGALLFDLSLVMARDDDMANKIERLMATFHVGDDTENPPESVQSDNVADTMRAMGRTVKYTSAFISAAIDMTNDSPVVDMFRRGQLTQLQTGEDSATAFLIPEPKTYESSSVDIESGSTRLTDERETEQPDTLRDEEERNENSNSKPNSTESTESAIDQPSLDTSRNIIEFRKANGGWWVHLPDEVFEQQPE